jgi:SlyX protein
VHERLVSSTGRAEADEASPLVKIETKLAFLEDFLTSLQNESLKRNAEIDRLASEQKAMKALLLQIAKNMEELPNQKPPHY